MTLKNFGLNPQNLTALIFLYISLILIVAVIGITLFYVKGFGIYKMSRNLKIKRSWYGFVPFFNVFAFGRLADAANEKKTNNRSLLVVLYILKTILYVAFFLVLIIFAVNLLFAADEAVLKGEKLDSDIFYALSPAFYLLCVSVVLDILYGIVNAVCAVKVYKLFGVKSPVAIAVIGFFIPFTIPFFVCSVCKNEPHNKQNTFLHDDAVFSING